MYKLAIVGTAISVVAAAAYHPVNQEIIDEIKLKAKTWKPMELAKNPLAKMSADDVLGLMCGHNSEDSNEFFAEAVLTAVPDNFDWRD